MKMTIKKGAKGEEAKNTAVKDAVNAHSNYGEASVYIRCAISALGEYAKESDTLARESIANLSVILMDLQP